VGRAHPGPKGGCAATAAALPANAKAPASSAATTVVPGLIDGQAACVNCSGVPVDVECRRCGREAPMGFAVTCWRCQLEDQLNGLQVEIDHPRTILPEVRMSKPSA
jgi:hypothetical protein